MPREKTLKDIAQELGLSHTTVSRALNDHPRIRPETKELVRDAAERIGYLVNSSARRLRGHPSALVGLIVPDIRNPVFGEIARIVSEMFSGTPTQLVLAVTGDNPEREEQSLRALAEAQVAGVLLVPSSTPTDATLRLLHRLRTTLLIREHPAVAANHVGLDEGQAIGRGVEHLAALGHRHIGFVGLHTTTSSGVNRLRGFMDGCARAGLPVDQRHIVLGRSTPEFGQQAMTALFDEAGTPPSGIVIGGVQQALGCIAFLDARQLRTPEDLSVVALGDPPWFEFIRQGLTAIRLPIAEMAEAAAGLLLQDASGRGPAPVSATQLRFASTLVPRRSSGPPR